MEIAFRIGNRAQELKYVLDESFIDKSSIINEVDTGYSLNYNDNKKFTEINLG